MRIARGATRTVFVFSKYVVKVPRLKNRKSFFAALYQGLLSNLQERYWSKFNYPQLCPIVFSDIFGLFIVMPYCEPIDEVLSDPEFQKFIKINDSWGTVPAENVLENFGLLNGRLVIIDYGT